MKKTQHSIESELQKFLFYLKDESRAEEKNSFLKNIEIIGCEIPLFSPNKILTQGTELHLPE